MKRKTHEEYVAELAVKNPNVEVIGKYINSTTKIEHHCLKHDVYWHMFPNNALRGCGCVKCGAEQSHSGFTKTHNEYINEIKNKNFDIVVLEKYINAKTPILHKCKVDGYEWVATPTSVLNSQGCPECSKRNSAKLRLKTHEQYIQELAVKIPSIAVVGKYVDSHTKILHHCSVCDYSWEAKPNNTLSGYGCPKCGGTLKKTHEQYVKEVSIINPNIDVVDVYIDAKTPILHKCKVHNVAWNISPDKILQGTGCRICGADKMTKGHYEYVQELKEINKDIIVLGKYINAKTPIFHKCKIDGYEWNAMPDKILQGQGCPQCNESKGERTVRLWLEKHSIKFEQQKKFIDCCDKKPLPFDFYLPEYNAVIEYNGLQHYVARDYFGGEKTLAYTQSHDRMKEEYCKKNNIGFLCIPYAKNVETELNNFLFI